MTTNTFYAKYYGLLPTEPLVVEITNIASAVKHIDAIQDIDYALSLVDMSKMTRDMQLVILKSLVIYRRFLLNWDLKVEECTKYLVEEDGAEFRNELFIQKVMAY